MADMYRVVWEGWRPVDFIREMELEIKTIMGGESFIPPFTSKKELTAHLKDSQPFYKKSIPEVNSYFAKKYGLK